MHRLEESVVKSLDATDEELFPYLPYILQDLWEMGASPEMILDIIKKHLPDAAGLKILDLGCGKGAVSIRLAKELNFSCHGIDAMPEFIDEARKKAREFGVEDRCRFEVDDIRTHVFKGAEYDVIVLGAIGPVFGNYYETLAKLSECLNDHGGIIIEDAFIDDDSDFTHALMGKKSTILKHIRQAGMILVDEYVAQASDVKESDDAMFEPIERRCRELMDRYPEKRVIFENYIKKQQEENEVLETQVHGTTMLIKRMREK